jgi:hypothetical protein
MVSLDGFDDNIYAEQYSVEIDTNSASNGRSQKYANECLIGMNELKDWSILVDEMRDAPPETRCGFGVRSHVAAKYVTLAPRNYWTTSTTNLKLNGPLQRYERRLLGVLVLSTSVEGDCDATHKQTAAPNNATSYPN